MVKHFTLPGPVSQLASGPPRRGLGLGRMSAFSDVIIDGIHSLEMIRIIFFRVLLRSGQMHLIDELDEEFLSEQLVDTQFHMRANLQVGFLFLGIVPIHYRLPFVILNTRIRLEAQQESNHLFIVILDCKRKSRSTGQVTIVDPGVSLK